MDRIKLLSKNNRLFLFGAVVGLIFFASCGSSTDGNGGMGYNPSDITIVFPATDTSISLDFNFSVTGGGDNMIGDVNISGSQGTIVINNQTLSTIIYARIPWETLGYDLYQGVAFSDTDFFVYWLYCSINNNSLDKVYYESSNYYELTREFASGTCDVRDETSQPSFSLAERSIGVNRLVSGCTITGNDISFSDAEPGTLTYYDTTFDLYPFDYVDCSGCSDGEWWELHSIAHAAAEQTTCFTILYLYAGSDSVFSSYSICFPNLDNINANLSGSWISPR